MGDGSLSQMHGEGHTVRKGIIMQGFKQSALEEYISPAQEIIRENLRAWQQKDSVLGYYAAKELTFQLASKLLIGFDVDKSKLLKLAVAFETYTEGMFSLPYYIPGGGFTKVRISCDVSNDVSCGVSCDVSCGVM